ncbi:hypothetical protein [Marixanthomonas ophiurae]|uniref:Uncharacterized protein n=1 Tax=Marixanthomonas ophiurae TaxID=387659 RepID=A0A3E1QDN2_9FLAO|nr:hypothetical protein [Marixanthomonas ophiurae]RFN60232.1 hypothetical protein DZ858_09385 [Marixanthomonas ophiurae]
MFYYIASKKPKLEVSIVENCSEADLERVFLFIDALAETPEMEIVFKVLPSVKKQFTKTLMSYNWNPVYAYNIEENIPK